MMHDSIEFDHDRLRRYLLSSGWAKQQDQLQGVAEQYVKDKKVLNLVIESSLPSYKNYLKDTVDALSIFESEDLDSLIQKIERTGSHKISLVIDEGKVGHRIRLTDSKKLRSNMSEMLLAVSHSALSPAISHPRLSRRDAVDLHSEFFEDQTERSSYVANFLIPDMQVENLSGQMVVDKFNSAISSAVQVASREVLPAPEEYDNLAKQGISANFLSALSDLKGIGTSDQIKFKIDGQPDYSLSDDYLSNLNDFYKEITTPAKKTVTLEGEVIAMTAAPETTVTVESEIDAVKRVVRVKVSSDQYKQVVAEEHKLNSRTNTLADRPIIRITGILRSRSRGRHEVVEISSFNIIVQ